MFGLGWPELIGLLLVALLLFGAGRLPEVARQLGKAVQELKKALKGGDGSSEE
ncbi:MAG: twin-arginine translocase TatA/TatE family subunit [Candidatus Omnitrophica bacterium CG11_big_fil_rev_8_21_14_0_20_64_10]|nr:MAG: twin-arginine translocase TatA/TatE family subunit [Candidatus Omnitrophica bacterium CG11_big_fil_rev_8_21_14_0_20_64_10]